jgi:hypothetical protein
MASLDVNEDYSKVQSKIESSKAYKDLKDQYKKAKKKNGDSYEKKKSEISQRLDSLSGKTKSFQKNVKTQFDQLLNVNETTGKSSVKYIKQKFNQTIKVIKPKLNDILFEELIKLLGCDQQPSYTPNVPVYVKISSIDLFGLLKTDPADKVGKLLYEKRDLVYQSKPFSMNKGLYQITQSSNSYFVDNSANYIGQSNLDLLDIKYLEQNPITGQGGGWFEVTPKARPGNYTVQFVKDYYESIEIFESNNVYAWIIQIMTGALSIKMNSGDAAIKDQAWLSKMIQRVLGLCFDNTQEIDVSGVAKVSQSDGIDESFFELSEIDLRQIEQKVIDIKNGVIEFEDCENVKVPVNTDVLLNELDKMLFVKDEDFANIANNLPYNLIKPSDFPDGNNLPNFTIFDKDFIKNMINGILAALLSPKILLPIATMLKSTSQFYEDQISSFEDFFKKLKQFCINLFSRIFSIFIEELFNIIKKDIKNLIASILTDITNEIKNKKVKMILKLTQLLIIGLSLIKDWRKCKSIVDELLALLALSGIGANNIPLPLLFTSRLLGGYSSTRAFIGTIEELQKIGVPTGPLPDGSPNLTVLAMFSQIQASTNEEDENGKVQVALGPLTMTPAGFTVPANAFGKKL